MPDVKLQLLQHARIASPCPMRWEDMQGDDKIRHCRQCDLHVHNFAAMTEPEAEALLAAHFTPDGHTRGQRLCGALFLRADGTILTRDCPVGLAALRAKTRRAAARCVLALGAIASSASALGLLPGSPWRSERLRDRDPFQRIAQWIDPAAPTPPRSPGEIMVGKMAAPTPAPAPTPPAPAPSNNPG